MVGRSPRLRGVLTNLQCQVTESRKYSDRANYLTYCTNGMRVPIVRGYVVVTLVIGVDAELQACTAK